MHSLDDLRVFHAIVTRGSFTDAAASLGMPKATVSKRLARLEAQLGVRLLQRSTRRLRMTETGEAVFAHAEVAMVGATAALAVASAASSAPAGTVTMSCPQGLMQNLVAPMLQRFLLAHPKVSLDLRQRNSPADLIADGIDVGLRVRTVLNEEAAVVVKRLGIARGFIVASPTLTRSMGDDPLGGGAMDIPLLSVREHQDWWPRLSDDGGKPRLTTRMLCDDFSVLLDAAIAGLGVALVPEHICNPFLSSGALVRWLPTWEATGIVHAVFPSRIGLPSATRALLSHLADEFKGHGA